MKKNMFGLLVSTSTMRTGEYDGKPTFRHYSRYLFFIISSAQNTRKHENMQQNVLYFKFINL